MAFDKVVTAKSTQTAFDLALQLHGNVDEVFTLIEENPEIENLETDVTGIEVSYRINDTFVQKSYISKGVSVSSKPRQYRNTSGLPALKIGTDAYLLITNGYKLLI